MKNETLYKYVGLVVVVLFLGYIIFSALNLQSNVIRGLGGKNTNIIEGATTLTANNKEQIIAAITRNTSTADDALIVPTYRKDYTHMIDDLEYNARVYILGTIVNNAELISANPGDPTVQALVQSVNTMNTFRTTLNDTIRILKEHP